MYFPSSGRRGFNRFRDNISITKGTKPELIAMLKKENEYRMKEEWIEKMEKEFNEMKMESPLAGYKYDLDKGSPVILELQTEVVKTFGYTSQDEIKEAILRLRSAQATYPNDSEILNAANYLKYNRIKQGNFQIGDIMNTKDIELIQSIPCDEDDDKNEDKKEQYKKLNLDDILNKKNKNLNLLIACSVS